MRARTATLTVLGATMIVLGAATLAGCGAGAPRVQAPLQLTLTAPADGTRIDARTVTVTGTVSSRRARVLVLGQATAVNARGRFSAVVPLGVGTNLIDVIASKANARPALTAVRVVRYELITVPQVSGLGPTAAAAAVRAAGLIANLTVRTSPVLLLLRFPVVVCSQAPAAGTRVAPASTVSIEASEFCRF